MSGTITITNGLHTIVLGQLVTSLIDGYEQEKTTTPPKKNVPGKTTPTVDVDAYDTKPRTFFIEISTTSTEKTTLDLIESDRLYVDITDDEKTWYDLWMTSIKWKWIGGSSPWKANINIESTVE